MKIIRPLIAFLLIHAVLHSSTIYVPDDHPTIQGAIDAAITGDTVLVRPGTYVENINFSGKAITVRSEEGTSVTTIDGSQAGSVVTFNSGEGNDSVISGFLITNGTGRPGPPFNQSGGGGIYCLNSSPTITNNILSGNTASTGGGIFCADSSAIITGNTVSGNEARYYGGGGIYCYRNSPTITYNSISGNKCENGASGAGIKTFRSSATIARNSVTGNRSWHAAGIEIEESCALVVQNIIKWNVGQGMGGGIWCYRYSPIITGNFISGNTAEYGGGIASLEESGSHTIRNNIIVMNHAASHGGGIYCSYSDPTITNNTLTWNSADVRGGGIYCGSNSESEITNTIVWDNTAPEGPEIYTYTYNNPIVTYCDVKGFWSGTGNIDAAPLWADPAEGDFHLNWDSPCKDAGDPNAPELPSIDAEGDPRFFGSSVDMGADEFHPHLYCLGDVVPGQTISFHVVGEPGQPVEIALGMDMLEPPYPTPHGNLYIWPLFGHWSLGIVPGSGILIYPTSVPSGWGSGLEYPFQALLGGWGDPDSILTNLTVLKLE